MNVVLPVIFLGGFIIVLINMIRLKIKFKNAGDGGFKSSMKAVGLSLLLGFGVELLTVLIWLIWTKI
ncbi:hypothetical protein [Lactococcus protaetiae]|uniref:Uncharacterized protein n=1 Tax=Lactococcus protaetiae TaxID=2592653 RepID=A0A514Z7A5_9LACT|nr:hypothetical protein [Lactococcus protaetiae]QDK70456.1 hypothetical protein FLP15_03795 [Lactococcus protaetiae]